LRPRVGLTILGLALVLAAPLRAQTLVQVDDLAREGRLDEARRALLDWWDASAESAARGELQHAFWLRGALTLDPDEAARDYVRLVVEYPGGPFTARAALRLARFAEARGDVAEADRYLRAVARDHPGSPERLEALAALEDLGQADPPADDLADDLADDPPDEPADGVAGAGSGVFSVQLGAFSDPGRAAMLVDRLRSAGHQPRLANMQGGDLVRVRLGRFERREAAQALADTLVAAGLEAVVVSDAHRERGGG